MITLLQQPDKFLFAKQPAIFKVQTSLSVPIMFYATVQDSGTDNIQAVNHLGQFDLSEYFDVFEYTETLLSAGVHKINLPEKYVLFFDKAIGNPALPSPYTTDPYLIVNGAVPRSRKNEVYTGYDSFLDYIIAKKKAFTWHPENVKKKIAKDQAETIVCSYLVNNASPVYLVVKLYTTDGEVHDMYNDQGFHPISNPTQYSVYSWDVGYDQLGIDAYIAQYLPGKTVDYYTVQIWSDDLQRLAGPFAYKVVSFADNPHTLVFKNNYGFPETVYCTGKSKTVSKLTFEIARTDGSILPDSINVRVDRTRPVEANTGFITKEQSRWLADLVETNEAFEVIDGVLHPVTLTDFEIDESHSDVDQYSATIKYNFSITQGVDKA